MFIQSIPIFCVLAAATVVGVGASVKNTRMTNATKITIDQAPYIVSFRDSYLGGQHNCGGTLLTPRFVLTAAHCFYVDDELDRYTVVGNVTTLSEEGQRRGVAAFFIHPEYDRHNGDKDVAIVKLDRDMTGEYARPMELCDRHLVESDYLQVSGWGVTKFGSQTPSEHLRSARVPVMSQQKCASKHAPGEITDAMVCAIGKKGEDACTTDSGGPAIYKNKLCASVSWGRGCGDHAGVYVRIDAVRDFIEDCLKK